MGAGGISAFPHEFNNSETQALGRAPTSKPPFTLGELKRAIPPHCFKRSLFRSFSYLFYDLCAISILYYLATNYIPLLPHPLPYLAWPLYWILQGCVFMGLWFLGHETGHHAFSEYQLLNDCIGFLIHSAFLTPYFSWKISHRRHHSNTGSLEHDEVHVPKPKSKIHPSSFYLNNPLGRALTLLVKLTLGWYIYLSINGAGRHYDTFANHFDPRSPIFSDNERIQIFMSDVGILAFGYGFYNLALTQGFAWVFCVYGGPSMVMNAFIVIVTYLQHTHPSLPRYDKSEWDWLRGALTTVDRDYGILNMMFHRTTDCHVVHHLFSTIPHYHAIEATQVIKPILGDYYQRDTTPFLKALWRESKKCLFVEPEEGEQQKKGIFWFKDKF